MIRGLAKILAENDEREKALRLQFGDGVMRDDAGVFYIARSDYIGKTEHRPEIDTTDLMDEINDIEAFRRNSAACIYINYEMDGK